MAEGREYVSRTEEMGGIHISEEVLSVIATVAALEVEGVAGLASSFGMEISDFIGKKHPPRGVQVEVNGTEMNLNLSILIQYGYAIPEVSRRVQDAVFSSVEGMSGLPVASVNIRVGGISFGTNSRKKNEK